MTKITTNQLEQILDLLGEGNERVADAREMLQKIKKPKLKAADMSVFINKPVLIEFWDENEDNPDSEMGWLCDVDKGTDGTLFFHQGDIEFRYAQPDFGYCQPVRNSIRSPDFWDRVDEAGFTFTVEGDYFKIEGYRYGFGPRWECEQ